MNKEEIRKKDTKSKEVDKIKEIMSLCNGYMNSCEKTADKILDRLETNNPIFWQNIWRGTFWKLW